MTVAARMNDLGTESAFEVLAKARALEAQGKEIIHLEIGEPDFETPRHIVEAGMQAISDGFTHYGPTAGLPELREAIARNSGEVRGTDTEPANVVVTPGAKPIMFYVLLALGEPGVEVIYPNPGFPIYESMIKFSGATPVPMQLLEEKDYHPDLDRLPGLITDKTRLIIINSPENPCGSALNKQELETIAGVVMRHPDLYVLSFCRSQASSTSSEATSSSVGEIRRSISGPKDGCSKSFRDIWTASRMRRRSHSVSKYRNSRWGGWLGSAEVRVNSPALSASFKMQVTLMPFGRSGLRPCSGSPERKPVNDDGNSCMSFRVSEPSAV